MDFRFQNTESGKLMQKLIVKIIVKISGKFTSTAVQLFPALALRGKCEKILLFVFVLFCFFFVLFFHESWQRKKPNTVYDDSWRPRGNAFRKTGTYRDAIFYENKAHFVNKTATWKWLVHELFLRSWKSRPLFREIINLIVDTFQDFQGICCWCLEYTCTQ